MLRVTPMHITLNKSLFCLLKTGSYQGDYIPSRFALNVGTNISVAEMLCFVVVLALAVLNAHVPHARLRICMCVCACVHTHTHIHTHAPSFNSPRPALSLPQAPVGAPHTARHHCRNGPPKPVNIVATRAIMNVIAIHNMHHRHSARASVIWTRQKQSYCPNLSSHTHLPLTHILPPNLSCNTHPPPT